MKIFVRLRHYLIKFLTIVRTSLYMNFHHLNTCYTSLHKGKYIINFVSLAKCITFYSTCMQQVFSTEISVHLTNNLTKFDVLNPKFSTRGTLAHVNVSFDFRINFILSTTYNVTFFVNLESSRTFANHSREQRKPIRSLKKKDIIKILRTI